MYVVGDILRGPSCRHLVGGLGCIGDDSACPGRRIGCDGGRDGLRGIDRVTGYLRVVYRIAVNCAVGQGADGLAARRTNATGGLVDRARKGRAVSSFGVAVIVITRPVIDGFDTASTDSAGLAGYDVMVVAGVTLPPKTEVLALGFSKA